MDLFDPREPVNTWSHGLWLAFALPGIFLLWRRGRGDRGKQWSFLVYGLGLVGCSAASTLYHGVRAADDRIRMFALIDYMGIYTLIAGSYTAIVWNVLSGSWRRGILMVVWLWAVAGSAHRLLFDTSPVWVSTAMYLAMGWGAVLCYFEVARRVSHRNLLPIVVGGVLYSLGAVINLLHQPVLWPGVFQAHELFHIFVVAGSLAHYWFMLTVIAPYVGDSEVTSPVLADRGSARRFTASAAPGHMGG
jgi:hemolysin III